MIAHRISALKADSLAKEKLLSRSINSLGAYRMALVTAAVTGQIDVRQYGKEAT
jgi:hypothetical protein